MYIAHSRQPDNEMVKRSINAGLQHATLFKPETPTDVLEWLRDWHNEFHCGTGHTFLQLFAIIPTIEAAWRSHTIKEGITARHGKNGKKASELCFEFIKDKFPQAKVTCMSLFDCSKCFIHSLGRLGLMKEFTSFMGAACQFNNPALRAEATVYNFHALMICISKFDGDYTTNSMQQVAMECMAFMVPLTGSALNYVSRKPPWALEKFDNTIIARLKTTMEESVVMKRARAAEDKAIAAGSKNQAPTAEGRQRKKARRKLSPASGVATEQIIQQKALAGERETMWLDDCLRVIFSAIGGEPTSKAQCATFKTMVSLCLEFAFTKKGHDRIDNI